jgi:DNA-binding Lrp family transcriptional regulator
MMADTSIQQEFRDRPKGEAGLLYGGRLMPELNPPAVLLDETDRKLVAELLADGRASYVSLASKVAMSQSAVRARVQGLLDERVICITAAIDPASVGLGVYGFALVEVDGPVGPVAAAIAEIIEASFVVHVAGQFALLCDLRCRDDRHLLEVLARTSSIPSVSRVEGLRVVEFYKRSWAGIAAEQFGPTSKQTRAAPVPATRPLDEVDRRLIQHLVEDGRATNSVLASAVGLTRASAGVRVQRLLKEGVVTIQTTAHADVLGVSSFSLILLSVSGDAGLVSDCLREMPEVIVLAATLGRYDLMCEVWCRDDAHLVQTLESVRAIPGARRVGSAPYLSIIKEQYRVGGCADNGQVVISPSTS